MGSASPSLRSMADLARLAGVSVSTVSRALTGKGTLNAATRERIHALAAEHGFRLNVAAQNLRLGRTGAIGVLFALGHECTQSLTDPFFSAMLGHIAAALADHGHDVLLSRALPQGDDWLDNFARSGRTDGIILIGQSDQGAVINRTGAQYAPMVVWGAHDAANSYLTVGTDNAAGGALVARHLMQRGCRAPAWFGPAKGPEFVARRAGFVATLRADLRAVCADVPCPITPEGSLATVRAWFGAGHRADAVFAASDIVAISVLSAAAEYGIAVPGQMAVAGFDDIVQAQLCHPPLTTVHQDIPEAARLLVELLLRRIAGSATRSVCLAPRLVVRQSA
jgi:DNA-binding LacI/PurR family transcriptional regulator